MRPRAIIALLLAVTGCQIVAGLETRGADPVKPGCALPALGDGKLRVANLVPRATVVDFCVRTSGAASYGRPVLAGNYAQCPTGYGYASVSATFGVPAGSIDVKAIAYGGNCDAPAIAEAKGVAARTDTSVTVALMGGTSGDTQLVALTDTVSNVEAKPLFRVVNANATLASALVGFTTAAHLPADIETPLVSQGVPYLGTTNATNATAPVDANGYFAYPVARYYVGLGPFGQTKASILGTLPGTASRTLFAIGAGPGDLDYPQRGLLCEDRIDTPDAVSASCTSTELPLLTVDSYPPDFSGAGELLLGYRYGKVAEAVAARTSDVVCLSEIELDAETIVLDKAKAAFPYIYSPETDENTPITDPRDQNGNIPPEPTTPPCGGTVTQAEVDAVTSCLAQNCSTTGDASGVLSDETATCISGQCVAPLTPLYLGDLDHKRCFQCLVSLAVDYRPYSMIQSKCSTDPHSLIGDGASSVAILSKLPIVESDMLVMPTALNPRRLVLFSRLQIEPREPDKLVDVYCSEFDNPDLNATFHYVGQYAPADSANGYIDETKLQADQLIAWVKKKSGSRPAIIAGDWHSSLRHPSDPSVPADVDDVYPQILTKLRNAFVPAEPPGFVPHCTACVAPENPYRAKSRGPRFENGTFLFNFDPKATIAAFRSFDQFIPLPDTQLKLNQGPMSTNFGWTVQIVRPQ